MVPAKVGGLLINRTLLSPAQRKRPARGCRRHVSGTLTRRYLSTSPARLRGELLCEQQTDQNHRQQQYRTRDDCVNAQQSASAPEHVASSLIFAGDFTLVTVYYKGNFAASLRAPG